MDLTEARKLTALHLLTNDLGDPPLSVAPWAWTDGLQWLTHANTAAALEGRVYYGVADAPYYLVNVNAEVLDLDWEDALDITERWTRHGPPAPEPIAGP